MSRIDSLKWLKAITYIGIYGGLLMPLMFVPIVIFPFVFSKLLFFQVLIGLTFPAYIVLAWIEPKYRPRLSLLYLAIVAYFVALGLSVLFSVDVARSWWGNQERMNGLFTLLHFLAWLTMMIGTLKTWTDWRRLLNYQVALSVFMAGVAILQRPFPNLLRFPAVDRVGGLLDNPIYMGAYQIFNLFFIALLWLKGSSRNMKIWYAVAAGCDIAAFVFAQSRGALAGLGIGLLVFAIVYGVMSPSRRVRFGIISAVVLAMVGYGLLFAFRTTSFVQQSPFARFTNLTATTRTRLIAWEIAWKGFLDRPVTGWGLDTFHILFNEKYNPESLRFSYYETWFDRSHNTVMDVLSMTGIAGLITFIAIFAALYISVFRAYRRGWIDLPIMAVLVALPIAYLVQNLFVFDHPAAFSMSYLLYGFVIAATTQMFMGTPEDSSPTNPRPVPWVFFGALTLAMLLVIWKTSWQPLQASRLSILSNTASAQGRLEEAYDFAKRAAAIPTPYTDEQSFLQTRIFISLAGPNLTKLAYWKEWHDLVVHLNNRHTQAHPRNTHPHFIFARFAETLAPYVPEDMYLAEREYKEAIRLSPKRQQLYYSYARFLIQQGRKDEAYELLKQVVSFDEEIGESHWLLGLHLMFDRGEQREGAEHMVKALEVKAPYTLQQPQEAMALAFAYDLLGQKEKLRNLISLLSTLPRAESLDMYIQIARAMEHQGLTEERDKILQAIRGLDPTLGLRLQPLFDGSATSINDAFKKTEGLSAGIQAVPSTATATASGPGPRAK